MQTSYNPILLSKGNKPVLKPLISIISPAYNEALNLSLFVSRIEKLMQDNGLAIECIFVNDGSTDNTLEVLSDLHRQNSFVNFIDLSRNFGQQAAIAAGLQHASGVYIVVMDADLQDPPELIPAMLKIMKSGNDVVYAVRKKRIADSWFKRWTAAGYYRFMRAITNLDMPMDAGDFRMINRNVLNALHQLKDHHRLFRAQISWLGFKQAPIYFERPPRNAGETGYTYGKLLKMGMDGMTAFAYAPLKWPLYAGVFTLLVFTLLFSLSIAGFANLESPAYHALLICLVGVSIGVLLMLLGIMGEFISRMNIETRRRPPFIIRSLHFHSIAKA